MLISTITNSNKILFLIEEAFFFIYYFHIRYMKENKLIRTVKKQKFRVGIQTISIIIIDINRTPNEYI